MKITEFDHRRISELVERARLDVDESSDQWQTSYPW